MRGRAWSLRGGGARGARCPALIWPCHPIFAAAGAIRHPTACRPANGRWPAARVAAARHRALLSACRRAAAAYDGPPRVRRLAARAGRRDSTSGSLVRPPPAARGAWWASRPAPPWIVRGGVHGRALTRRLPDGGCRGVSGGPHAAHMGGAGINRGARPTSRENVRKGCVAAPAATRMRGPYERERWPLPPDPGW